MERTVLEALAIASSGLVSIGSILIVLLLLSSARGLRKASAYGVGYVGGYIAIGLTALVVGDLLRGPPTPDGESIVIAPYVTVGLGMLMFFFAIKRMRSPKGEGGPPKIFATLDDMSTKKVLGIGALITVINFKNLALYLSAVAVIVDADLLGLHAAGIIVGIAFFFCVSVFAPILLHAVFSARALPWLKALKRQLATHNRVFTIVLLFSFGTFFVGRGLYALLA